MVISMKKHKFSLTNILLAGALIATSPGKISPADLSYEPYKRASEQEIREILVQNNYPSEFDFCYDIPSSTDARGNSVNGSFRVTKKDGSTNLELDIIHKQENKLIEVSEIINGDNITYIEKNQNFATNQIDYETRITRPIDGKIKTPVSLLEDLFSGNLKDTKFVFYGKDRDSKKYEFDVKKQDSSCVEAQIKGDSPRFRNIKVFFEKIDGVNVPVEIWAEYEIKLPFLPSLFGLNYDSHTIKAVLRDTARE
jgi:hypothetical protein